MTTQTKNSTIPTHLQDLIKRGSFAEFTSLANARSHAARCVKTHWIILGDIDEDGLNGKYWVVMPADAARLEKSGYQIIR